MKTLVIVTHPNIENSRINKTWMEAIQNQDNVTIHQLYTTYPDQKIDVSKEHELLSAHDRIILQFPFQWYSTPALLKEWFDRVLVGEFGIRSTTFPLRGKHLGVAVSTFGPAESYQPTGYNRYTMEVLLKPIQATATNPFIGMTFMTPHILHGIGDVTDEQLAQNAAEYVKYVTMQSVTV
ncbi:NAD(P)H-dependent oxidoreductase [Neobacillus sp. NRS-1170]|uniref:NAD(P)H-dependent oxidoreductase n=1 Tax=Neobacillus sp. NRS-1170 TaxID=3233898 RepID=UPI003D2A967D